MKLAFILMALTWAMVGNTFAADMKEDPLMEVFADLQKVIDSPAATSAEKEKARYVECLLLESYSRVTPQPGDEDACASLRPSN